MNRLRRAPRLLGLPVLFALAAGCGAEQPSMKAPGAEEAYAEAMLVPAAVLGAGWGEFAHEGIAHQDGGDTIRWPVKTPGLIGEGEADLVGGGDAPCRILFAVAYSAAEDAPGAPPALRVTYFYQRMYALPLEAEDPLPVGFAKSWHRGADGIAMGVDLPGGEAPAGEPELFDAPDSPEQASAPAPSAPAPAAARPKTGGISPPTAQDWGVDPDWVIAEVSPEEIARLMPPGVPLVHLAAHGVVVRFEAAAGLSHARTVHALAAVRRQLALKLGRQRVIQTEMDRRRANRKQAVTLKPQVDPGSRFYWGLLEKAMGVVYKKKY